MKERSKTPVTKQIARERIEVLFEQARLAFAEFPDLSNRYVELARRIAMRQRIRITQELRRKYCHYCNSYLVPGSNVRVRVHCCNIVVTCLACKKHTRYHMVKPHAGRSEQPDAEFKANRLDWQTGMYRDDDRRDRCPDQDKKND